MAEMNQKEKLISIAKSSAMTKTASVSGGGGGKSSYYPSPYLTLSDYSLPEKMTELFEWCKYFYLFDPIVAGGVNAKATFPITDIILDEPETFEEEVRAIQEEKSRIAAGGGKEAEEKAKKIEVPKRSQDMTRVHNVLFSNLKIYNLLIEIGIDYHLFGNCFIMGEMKNDGGDGEGESEEKDFRWKGMRRIDPRNIVIETDPVSGAQTYKWRVSERIRAIIKKGKPKAIYDSIPKVMKDAVKGGKDKAIVLDSSSIYHFKRPGDSLGESAWGTPEVANIMKLLMYRNILRQAQEAVAREHIVPMRIYYFPREGQFAGSNMDWNAVASDFSKELQRATVDPNYRVVSPVPVQQITIGGNGRTLLLTPEIEQVQGEILAGMNVPREFIFGGVSYSGSTISIRILENHFMTYRLLLKDFIQNFLIKGMAKANKTWVGEDDDRKIIQMRFADLKMQDDVQQKQTIVNLNSNGKITDEYLYNSMGIDPERMKKALNAERIEAIDNQKEVQIAQIKANVEVQKANMQAQKDLQLHASKNGQTPPDDPGNGQPVPTEASTDLSKGAPKDSADGKAKDDKPVIKQEDVNTDSVPSPSADDTTQSNIGLQKMSMQLFKSLQQNPGGKEVVKHVMSKLSLKDRAVVTQETIGLAESMGDAEFTKVVKEILGDPREHAGGGNGVDMRPHSEQLPERRKP